MLYIIINLNKIISPFPQLLYCKLSKTLYGLNNFCSVILI